MQLWPKRSTVESCTLYFIYYIWALFTPDDCVWNNSSFTWEAVVRQRWADFANNAGQALSKEEQWCRRCRFSFDYSCAHFCILCCLCPSLRPSLHFATIHLCFIRRNQEAPSACQVAVIWSLLYSTFFYSLRTPSLLLYRSVTIALDRRLGIQAASFLDWIRCLSTAACRNWISPLVLRVVRS